MKHRVDVLVYDSTSSGLIAAITAARRGLRVLVITEDKHLGGMQTAGLGNTNTGEPATLSGYTREFHDRILAWYRQRYGADSRQVTACRDGWFFEPHVAEAVFEAWIAEHDIEIWRQVRLVAVDKERNRLVGIRLADGRHVMARAFIDASYEGDLAHLAHCTTRIGREAVTEYREKHAGIRAPAAELGLSDHLTQAYDYRLCLTQSEDRLPFERPEGYDADLYEDWRAHFRRRQPTTLARALPLNMMPNGKTDSRSGEWVGGCTHYPAASFIERQAIAAAHKRYTQGWIWFLLTDPVIPTHVQDELRTWGHAADEFVDNDNWPYHLYVREARRLVGDWVMTEHHIFEREQPDAIGIGSFYLDVHAVRTIIGEDGQPEWEGSLNCVPVKPYAIPYRVSLPRQDEADNLWTTFTLSASHVAFSTLRMEPYFTQIGQAAGNAAALAIDSGCPAAKISIGELQKLLSEQGQRHDPMLFPNYWPSDPA